MTETETQRHRETETEKERDRERETEKERDTERDRQRHRDRESLCAFTLPRLLRLDFIEIYSCIIVMERFVSPNIDFD